MRRHFLMSLGLFTSILVISATAMAGNVLVPKGTEAPNLGLMPPKKQDETKASDKEKEAQEKEEAEKAALDAKLDLPEYKSPPVGERDTSTFEILGKKKKKKPHRTYVISMTDFVEPQNKNLPNAITISFSDKSTLSEADAQKIRKKLGLSSKEISRNCYLAPVGMLYTNKGHYLFGRNLSHRSTVRYDGMIDDYNLRARAMCKVTSVPANVGPLVRIADRIQVTLKKVDCPAPTRPVKGLIVTYTGTKSGSCEYQY